MQPAQEAASHDLSQALFVTAAPSTVLCLNLPGLLMLLPALSYPKISPDAYSFTVPGPV